MARLVEASGVGLPDHFMTFLGAWSGVCAFNAHRYMTGGTIVAPGTFEFATSEKGNNDGLFILASRWLLLPVFLVAMAVGVWHRSQLATRVPAWSVARPPGRARRWGASASAVGK